ncbi:hypothetical protein G5C51_04650 [Streptomyces sp. A7024]|uniref:Uncharacterized protein n=1 Tax=Streptomyces coryli TaxID=1128680 RepID=A0A6G4TVQ6_9ACTN|nr:hypothetical protein [Streptomyces coryli]NGN63198.1 hypothetical protein [Streptomyces coryli]
MTTPSPTPTPYAYRLFDCDHVARLLNLPWKPRPTRGVERPLGSVVEGPLIAELGAALEHVRNACALATRGAAANTADTATTEDDLHRYIRMNIDLIQKELTTMPAALGAADAT